MPPQFFIPRLEDKPQNPIMDSIRLMQNHPIGAQTYATPSLPLELRLLSEDIGQFEQDKRQLRLEPLWELPISRKVGHMVRNMC